MADYGNGYTSRGDVDVAWWIREIHKGIAFRKKYAKEGSWDRWRKYYRGEWNQDVLPVNLFFRMARTIVPRIYFRNPSVVLTPNKPGLERLIFSQILQTIDNKLYRAMKLKQQTKRAIHNGFFFGTGVLKMGYGAQYSYTPSVGVTAEPVVKGKEVLEYNSSIKADMPWVMSTHTGQFIVPEGTVSYQDCRWSAVWIRRPVWDVENDPRLKNNKNLKGNAYSSSVPLDNKSKAPDLIDLIEVRDMKMRRVFVLAPFNTDRVLFDGIDDLQPNGRMSNYPIIFNDDDEVFWGVPDSVILEPQQLEINETRTLMMKHRRSTIAKIIAKRNALTESEAERMTDEDVSAVIWIDGEPLSDIKFTEGTGIPKDLFLAEQSIHNDVRENIGFSRNQVGNYAEGSNDKSATESQIVNAAAEIRLDERRDIVADTLVDITEDIHSVIFDRWQGNMVAAMIGPDGVPLWVRFRPEMLRASQADVTIDPDNAMPLSKQQKDQRASAIYEQLKPNPLINPFLLTQWYLQELSGSQMNYLIKQEAYALAGPGTNPSEPIDVNEYIRMIENSPNGGKLQQLMRAGALPNAAV